MRRSRLSFGQGLLAVAFLVALTAAACGGTEQVVKTVEVEKIVEKEVIKEVVKEVPVTKEVIKEVPVTKTVVATPTAAPVVAKTGTIPGSTLVVALESAGGETTEPSAGIPIYGCRPGCLAMKDDFFLMDPEGVLMPHVIKRWDFGPDTMSWTLDMQENIVFHNRRKATIDDLEFSIFDGLFTRTTAVTGEPMEARRSAYHNHYVDGSRRIVDDDTLQITFLNPTVAIPDMTMTVNRDYSGFRPKAEILEQGWEEWLKDPILSGAYKTVKTIPGERKELEVFVDWWKGPTARTGRR